MSKTLSEMFQEMVELKLGGDKVTAVRIYRVQDDSLGDNKVMGVVASKEMDLHRLISAVMTDRRFPKYKDCDVVAAAHDGDVFKVWISK